MTKYHKIQSIYKRDPETNYKTFLEGEWSLPEFGYLAEQQWCWTEKVDGTNIRIMWNHIEKKVTFNGKSDRAQLPNRLRLRLEEMVADYLPDTFERAFPDQSVCCYGEGYGAGIQKGGCYSEEQDFVLFDIKYGIDPGVWLQRSDVIEKGNMIGLSVVPIRGYGTLYQAIDVVKAGAKAGFKSHWGDFEPEGLVCRPAVELRSQFCERIITKIKCRDFPRG
jgi:hypothetical protein